MSYQQEEKLVRIRVKEGAHENTKVNSVPCTRHRFQKAAGCRAPKRKQ